MTKVVIDMSVSLDGFVAESGAAGENLGRRWSSRDSREVPDTERPLFVTG
jgi:hypothetical protein